MQPSKIKIPASIIRCINFLMIFDEIVQNEPRHGDLSLVGLCTCSGEQMEKPAKTFVFYSARVLPPVPEILLVLQLNTVVLFGFDGAQNLL